MKRRRFFEMMAKGGGALAAGIVGIPSLLFALAPVFRGRPREVWRPVGRLEDFAVGDVQQAEVDIPRDEWARSLSVKGVYVWRPAEDEFVVFSRNCTDLSCPVTYDRASGWFYCPCHGGIFAQNGERMAGPPDRPLYRYANRVQNGMLEIDLSSLPPMT